VTVTKDVLEGCMPAALPDEELQAENLARAVRELRTHGSDLVSALERAWSFAAALHPDLPRDVVFVTGSGRRPRGGQRWGHHAASRWALAGERMPEVFVAGECVELGPARVLRTVLHEAAHALAGARGVRDTSGRYHNRRFVRLAGEVGLLVPTSSPGIGWSNCDLSADTELLYAPVLDDLAEAIRVRLPPPPPVATTAANRSVRLACGCPRPKVLRVSRRVADGGGILCADCGGEFA
jgi:hypothetical protein